MSEKSDLKSKLETIPRDREQYAQAVDIIQKNQDAIWNRLNNIDNRVSRIEKGA